MVLPFVLLFTNSFSHSVLISNLWDELNIGRQKRIYAVEDVPNAAQSIFELDPGPPMGNAKIRTAGFNLSQKKKRLLRRAFYN